MKTLPTRPSVVTDNEAISASDVILRAGNTAGVSNFTCTQTSAAQVDCTLEITSSGDLQITATDQAGNSQDAAENGYLITSGPDTEKPVITINAPTKSSTNENITDTTIVVTDNEAILASKVVLRAGNTAGASNFTCTQTSVAQVDCTLEITSSGDLKLIATDQAGNSINADETGYLVDKLPDSISPIIEINAPTKFSTTSITDTTIVVTDDEAILVSKVKLRSSNTAGVLNFSCTQTSTTRVDCTLEITSSGDLRLRATDEVGNDSIKDENGYLVTSTDSDKTKPSLQIFAPTKISKVPITNTKIVVRDNLAVFAHDVILRPSTTAGVLNFKCNQTLITRVDCTMRITASGDLHLSATDVAGNIKYKNEENYIINTVFVPHPEIMPVIQYLLLGD